jgi:hypothetical protein
MIKKSGNICQTYFHGKPLKGRVLDYSKLKYDFENKCIGGHHSSSTLFSREIS